MALQAGPIVLYTHTCFWTFLCLGARTLYITVGQTPTTHPITIRVLVSLLWKEISRDTHT